MSLGIIAIDIMMIEMFDLDCCGPGQRADSLVMALVVYEEGEKAVVTLTNILLIIREWRRQFASRGLFAEAICGDQFSSQRRKLPCTAEM